MSLVAKTYSSGDAGAPQLTGQVGSLLNLLRAILVTGYGSGGGAKQGLGWTESFTGVNKAVFRNNPINGTGGFLRILDDGSAAAGGSALTASLRAFGAMSDIDTGTDPAPTVAQRANGPQWIKSRSADSTPRGWWAIGTELCFYLFSSPWNPGVSDGPAYFAGDILSSKPGDQYHFGISNVATTAYDSSQLMDVRLFGNLSPLTAAPSVSSANLFLLRASTLAPGALLAMHLQVLSVNQLVYGGSNAITYPDPVSGGMLYDVAHVGESASRVRGRMPGLYVPLHFRPFSDLEQIAEPDGLPPGTVLVAKNFRPNNQVSQSFDGQVFFDLVNPWH